MANKAPPEIIGQIFDTSIMMQEDLLSYVKVCRKWSGPAKERLYRRVVVSRHSLRTLQEGFTRCGSTEKMQDKEQKEESRQLQIEYPGFKAPSHASRSAAKFRPIRGLVKSLDKDPDNANFIQELDLRDAAGFEFLPSCTALQRLTVGFDAYPAMVTETDAMDRLAKHRTLRRIPVFSLPLLPNISHLKLGWVDSDLGVQLLQACPGLRHLEFLHTPLCGVWRYASYPAIPPLKSIKMIVPPLLSYKTFKAIVGPVAGSLDTLCVMPTVMDDYGPGATSIEVGDVDSTDPAFWYTITYPNIRKFGTVITESRELPRLSEIMPKLAVLCLNLATLSIYDILPVLDAVPVTIEVLSVAVHPECVSRILSRVSDPFWLPGLRSPPLVWLSYPLEEIDLHLRDTWIEQLQHIAVQRGLAFTQEDAARHFLTPESIEDVLLM